ncbi:MAG TPA: glycolate oxidase subunit GlcE, partial [Nitrosospira sp.]
EPAVRAARAKLGGDEIAGGEAFWASVREQTHPFFSGDDGDKDLWRLSIKSTTPPLRFPGKQLMEWGGSLRWLTIDPEDTDATRPAIHQAAKVAGGHATLFRTDGPRTDVFHPLAPAMMTITRRLKEKFDPMGLFNPGRMYPEI